MSSAPVEGNGGDAATNKSKITPAEFTVERLLSHEKMSQERHEDDSDGNATQISTVGPTGQVSSTATSTPPVLAAPLEDQMETTELIPLLLEVGLDEHSDQDDYSVSEGGSTVSESSSNRPNTPTPGSPNADRKMDSNVSDKREVRTSRKGTTPAPGPSYRKQRKAQTTKTKKEHNYKYVCSAKEDHGQPIFGCQFRHRRDASDPLVLATVGSNRISVYECLNDGKLKMLQVYADPDSEEIFYCCAWTEDDTGKPLLAAAGARGIIRVISTHHGTCVKHYLGHGHSINDLCFHPKDQNLLLSASKDHSLRLYNIKTDHLVAIFGGVDGHRDEVISADIDITGSRIVSSGMDHSLKVWKLNKPKVEQAIAASYTHGANCSGNPTVPPFPTTKQHAPDFTTRDIHRNYVDCAKWLGEFILSKSCENRIICWKAGAPSESWDKIRLATTRISYINRYEVKEIDVWYIRFSMDYWKKVLALGNQSGKTYIYDLRTPPPPNSKPSRPATILTHPKCTSPIRQTSFSRDGRVLVCVCDDSTIWRWDLQDDGAPPGGSDNETET